MQQIMSLFVIVSLGLLNVTSISVPLNNGRSVKLYPNTAKENVNPQKFDALFARIPQASDATADFRREILSKVYFLHSAELGAGCTNQIAKILFPFKSSFKNDSILDANYINIPIIQQPFEDYKVVVATAPPNVQISGPEAKPLVVYIVFPEDEASDDKSINIPSVYFVKKQGEFPDLKKKNKVDPILIIDSNRTVTGLKSKGVAKFLKFKNKLTNRFDYEYEVTK